MPNSSAYHNRRSSRPGKVRAIMLFLLIAAVLGLVAGLILFLNSVPVAN